MGCAACRVGGGSAGGERDPQRQGVRRDCTASTTPAAAGSSSGSEEKPERGGKGDEATEVEKDRGKHSPSEEARRRGTGAGQGGRSEQTAPHDRLHEARRPHLCRDQQRPAP